MNDSESIDHFRLRRAIMVMLYRIFKEHPYSAVELQQIETECAADPKSLNWNLVYLEKSGYVDLGKSHDCAPYIAPFAGIAAAGIDLIEDRGRFDACFPTAVCGNGTKNTGVRLSGDPARTE